MATFGKAKPKRIGIIGYGSLGQYLYRHLKENTGFKIVFIWNRSPEKLVDIPPQIVLSDLKDFAGFSPDLIIEVAHPSVSQEFGPTFLQKADYFVDNPLIMDTYTNNSRKLLADSILQSDAIYVILPTHRCCNIELILLGSPTAFAVKQVEDAIRESATTNGAYIPSGALWGADDIKKMADMGSLESLRITMTKHPSAFKLTGELKRRLDTSDLSKPVTLYEGPVRDLCPLAPQNVNTMAAACIAGHTLGFDKTIGCLATDPSFDKHQVVIEVGGSGGFKVATIRDNPSKSGAVTGQATYASFLSSILQTGGKGPGLHLC